jgi:signal peptidase I
MTISDASVSIQTGDVPSDARGDATTARSVRRSVKDAVLTLAGLAGALCLVWFVLTAATGTAVIVFTTGSMAPTIPAGSAALVRTVPASEIAVGQVVTVVRSGSRLPVTHRVVSVAEDPGASNSRILVLRGDANATNDPSPYHVTQAKVVMASVPGLGLLMAVAGRPVISGITTIAVAALVTWAFWPSRRRAHRLEPRSGA